MPVTKEGKPCINVRQVDGAEWVHTLWSVKFCLKAGANWFSLKFKLLKGNMIENDHQNDIMVESSNGNFILDC